MVRQPKPKRSFSSVGIGATAMVFCCAAPALVAGGLLASLGAVVRSAVIVALGVAVVGGAVVFAVGRRRRGSACRPPTDAQASASLGDATNPATRPPR